MSPRRRSAIVAVVLVVLVAGVGLAAILSGDEEPEGPAATATAPGESVGDTGEEAGSEATTTAPEPTATAREPAASPRDEAGIERAVDDAVADTEAGRPPPGIEPGSLPGSDELSIESVRAEGDRGSATLSSGAVVECRRTGGRWRVISVRRP